MPPKPQPVRMDPATTFIKLLVYGKSGAGKTTLAATANDHPLLAPALFLNFEGGLLSVVGRGDLMDVKILTIDVLEEVFAALWQHDPDYAEYRTLVIDSGSEIASLALSTIVRRNKERGRGGAGRTVDDIQIDDYGQANAMIRRLFRGFRDLPMNVIITALPKFTMPGVAGETSGADPIEVAPDFSPRLKEPIIGMMDWVWYLYDAGNDDAGNSIRKVLTRDYGPYRAKTRGMYFSQAVPLAMENPLLPDLYELLLHVENPETRDATLQQLAERRRAETADVPAPAVAVDEVEAVQDSDDTTTAMGETA